MNFMGWLNATRVAPFHVNQSGAELWIVVEILLRQAFRQKLSAPTPLCSGTVVGPSRVPSRHYFKRTKTFWSIVLRRKCDRMEKQIVTSFSSGKCQLKPGKRFARQCRN